MNFIRFQRVFIQRSYRRVNLYRTLCPETFPRVSYANEVKEETACTRRSYIIGVQNSFSYPRVVSIHLTNARFRRRSFHGSIETNTLN